MERSTSAPFQTLGKLIFYSLFVKKMTAAVRTPHYAFGIHQ
jgi:hypothetical protein